MPVEVAAIPPILVSTARSIGAEAWIGRLPALVASLEDEWAIVVGHCYIGGTEAYVAEATMADGTPAVLKMLMPRDDGYPNHEAIVLRYAKGRGCALLHRSDDARGALLLERLGPSLSTLGLPLDRRVEILAATARALWRPAADAGLPSGAWKARWLADLIALKWDDLGHPCSERAIDHAIACAARREAAHDDEQAVLVHGDVHQWNTLQAGDGFKLVDPDGLLGEAEYDMGIVMREDPIELRADDPHERSRRLAALTGLDETAIWEWGVVERMSTGLLCLEVAELSAMGREMLATADLLAE